MIPIRDVELAVVQPALLWWILDCASSGTLTALELGGLPPAGDDVAERSPEGSREKTQRDALGLSDRERAASWGV